MYLILFVLHDTKKLQAILDTWDEIGVSGITILPSTGLSRLRKNMALQEDIPLIPRLEDFLNHGEQMNETIFTMVKEEVMVEKIIQATEKIIGNLNQPNTGILAVLPILKVYGLNREEGV